MGVSHKSTAEREVEAVRRERSRKGVWAKKACEVLCPLCGRHIVAWQMDRHMGSKRCQA